MASNPDDLHAPISNLARNARPTEEQLSQPQTGTEAGIAEPQGEIEAGGARLPGAVGTRESMALEAPDTGRLPDAGSASFDDPAMLLEAIIGVDERVRIPATTDYPYRAIASLLITANDGSQYVGTGWFISPRTLVTAGHCVYVTNSGRPSRDGWVKSVQVMPGRNGSQLPFGAVTSTQFWTVKGWADRADEGCDYGAIIVPTELGSRVGWLGYGVFPDPVLQSAVLNVTGYPGDKKGTEQGTLWHDSRRTGSVGSTKLNYDIDTVGGQSGAPTYMIRDGNRYVVAVHAFGGVSTNSGTRITAPVMANLNAWRR